MWTVVIFIEENSVEAIPSNWIQRDQEIIQAKWPPFRGTKLKNLIQKCEEPDPNWSTCKIRVLGKQIYSDYGEACRQSRKGAYTSDINSTDSEAPRKRISKKVQLSTSEEESSDELDVIIPNPPKDVFGSNKTNLEQTRIKERANKGNNQACNCLANKEQTEKLVLTLTKQYSLIYTKLQDISSDMARLAVHVERDKLPEKVDVLIYDLPLITEDALTDFEIFIDDVENYKKLIHFIKKIGGTTPYECVKRSLSRILTNSLADKFSWIGAKGKKAFKSLKLAKALIDGVQENPNTKDKAECEIEQSIKTWLRHAKERKMKEEKKVNDGQKEN